MRKFLISHFLLLIGCYLLDYQGFFKGMDSAPIWVAGSSLTLCFIYLYIMKKRSLKVLLFIGGMGVLSCGFPWWHSNLSERERSAIESQALNSLKDSTLDIRLMQHVLPPHLELDNTEVKQYTIVNFWAPWCPPCLEEFPYLEEVHQRLKAKVRFIGVTGYYRQKDRQDSTAYLAQVKEVIHEKKLSFPVVIDQRYKNYFRYQIQVFPTTLLFGSRGQIIQYAIGRDGLEGIIEQVERQVE